MPTAPSRLLPHRRARRTGSSIVFALGWTLALTACGSDGPVDPALRVASVTVTTAQSTQLEALGAIIELQATALDGSGDIVDGVDFEWNSSDGGIAAVDASGLVTAVANGSVTITASVNDVSGAISVSVAQVVAELAFLALPRDSYVDQPLGNVEVGLFDANGFAVEGAEGPVSVELGANSRGATLGGQSTRAASFGVATFTDLSVDDAGANYTLVATAGSATAESDPFDVTRPYLYIGDYGSGATAVTVVDLDSNGVVGTVATGSRPTGVAIAPDGLHVYVGSRGSNQVAVVETPGNTVTGTISVEGVSRVRASPAGTLVLALRPNFDSMAAIETATGDVVATIPVGQTPFGADFTPDEAFAYVANGNGGSVSVVEIASRSVIATIDVGSGPVDVVVTPDGEKAFVPLSGTDEIAVISTADNTVVATIPAGTGVGHAAVLPDGSAAFVANFGSDDVTRIDPATNTVTATIPVGDGPFALTAGPRGEFVYVANANDGTISVIEVATNTVTATIAVGGRPGDMAVAPAPRGTHRGNDGASRSASPQGS